jgi:hypothetical protein
LLGETVLVLWQNIKMFHGDEMLNNGSKMLKNPEQQQGRTQSQALLLSTMDTGTLRIMVMSVL